MPRPRLRKQIALPFFATAFFVTAYYAVRGVSGFFEPAQMGEKSRGVAEKATLIALILCAAFLLTRLIAYFVFYIFRKRKGYEAPNLIRDIFSIIIYTIVVALAINNLVPNVSLSALLPTSALLGVILGLALQDTLGNLFAGISLHADKPFNVGDVIVVGKFTGVVESITWRAVKIRTFLNHVVLVSNSQIAREQIEVCPRDNLNARVVFFNALYTDSPAKVIHVVREAVREADNVSRAMTPNVRIRELGASGVEYEVKYWLEDYARHNDTDALVRQRIWYAYKRAGLGFAYPTQTLYIERPAHQNGAAHAHRRSVAERLSEVDIFAPLTEEEIAALAADAQTHIYAPGETIIRAGDEGSSMFIVHRGHVEVRVPEAGGNGRRATRAVATLSEGEFFGEMALFTGEPRTASVVAKDETEVLEVGHEAIRRLFDANPDLVESLSFTIAQRRKGLKAQSAAPVTAEEEPEGILGSIKKFFRLI